MADKITESIGFGSSSQKRKSSRRWGPNIRSMAEIDRWNDNLIDVVGRQQKTRKGLTQGLLESTGGEILKMSPVVGQRRRCRGNGGWYLRPPRQVPIQNWMATSRAAQTNGGVGKRQRKTQKHALKKCVPEKLRGNFENLVRRHKGIGRRLKAQGRPTCDGDTRIRTGQLPA